MRKRFLVMLGFSLGLFLSQYVLTTDLFTLYLSYRIYGPKAVHVIEDLFTESPIPFLSLLVIVGSLCFLFSENARLKAETGNERGAWSKKGKIKQRTRSKTKPKEV